MQKKILLMTASIGSGHIKAAEAIHKELAARFPEAEIIVVDFMARRTSRLHWQLKAIYLKMLSFVPNLYDHFYRFSGGSFGGSFVPHLFSLVMCRRMKMLLEEHRPDLVVCTHPFPEGSASMVKRYLKMDFPLAAVLTDYSLHQIWVYPKVDLYFCATEEMRAGLIAQGFSSEIVCASGIPIDSNIFHAMTREAARQKFGIAETAEVVLLMGGGLGLGNIESLLVELETAERNLDLIVVAGRNSDLLEFVRNHAKHSRHRINSFGYTSEVYALMRAANLLITKPGALTISEAFALGTPLLLHEPIPGPETENAVYARAHGAAVWLHPKESVVREVERLFSAPERLRGMAQAAQSCAMPEAAKKIAGALERFL